MQKCPSEENTLIGIQAIREVIEIFSGPFLTTYFIKTSMDTIGQISVYNIFVYFILMVATASVCHIIKRKYKIEIFRLSVILNFVYILMIIILKEKVLEHLGILAVIYGISVATYWVPLGLFLIKKVKNEKRMAYETKNQMVKTIFKIGIPIVLGGMITISNYYMTAIIVLILSIIQIIFSFWLKPLENTYQKFDIKKAWNKIKGTKKIKNMLCIEYLHGLCIASSSLTVITTILIFNVLKTDLKLGIITSITSALQMLVVYAYNKKKRTKNDKTIILIASIIPMISLSIFLIHGGEITIVLYSILSQIATGFLTVIRTVQVYNIANHKLITIDEQSEFWTIREVCISSGRVTSYVLLLLVGLWGGMQELKILMIILTAIIILIGILQRYQIGEKGDVI